MEITLAEDDASDDSTVAIESRDWSGRGEMIVHSESRGLVQQRSVIISGARALIPTLIRTIYVILDNEAVSLITAVHLSRRLGETGDFQLLVTVSSREKDSPRLSSSPR